MATHRSRPPAAVLSFSYRFLLLLAVAAPPMAIASEAYSNLDLRIDVGLSDEDFDPVLPGFPAVATSDGESSQSGANARQGDAAQSVRRTSMTILATRVTGLS